MLINITLEYADVKPAGINLSTVLVISSEAILFSEPIPDDLLPTSPYDNGFMVKNSNFTNLILHIK